MAKCLTFAVSGSTYTAAPVKLDRKKLYGWHSTRAIAEDGSECTLVSMDESAGLLLPRGCIGMGNLSPEGEWVERSSLKTTALDGGELTPHKSSYDIVISLERTVNTEEFLNHTITAVYKLTAPPEFTAAVGSRVFAFSYNYRESYEQEAAFVFARDGVPFMLLGYRADFSFISLEQHVEDEDIDTEINDDDSDDELDFSFT
jgi:hypothetical protein